MAKKAPKENLYAGVPIPCSGCPTPVGADEPHHRDRFGSRFHPECLRRGIRPHVPNTAPRSYDSPIRLEASGQVCDDPSGCGDPIVDEVPVFVTRAGVRTAWHRECRRREVAAAAR